AMAGLGAASGRWFGRRTRDLCERLFGVDRIWCRRFGSRAARVAANRTSGARGCDLHPFGRGEIDEPPRRQGRQGKKELVNPSFRPWRLGALAPWRFNLLFDEKLAEACPRPAFPRSTRCRGGIRPPSSHPDQEWLSCTVSTCPPRAGSSSAHSA